MAVISDKLDHDQRLLAVLRRLVSETGWRHAPAYAAAFLLTFLVAATTAYVVYFAGEVLGGVLKQGDSANLRLTALLIGALFVIRGFATFGHAVLLTRIGNAIVLETQLRMFSKVVAQEPSYVARSSSGEIATLIQSSAGAAQSVLNIIVVSVGRDFFTLVGLLAVMFYTNWFMSLMMLIGLPIIVVVVSGVTKRLRGIARRHLEVTAMLGNRIRGAVQGIRVVKAFRMEQRICDVMAVNAEEIRKLGDKHAVVSNRVAPFMEIVAGVAFASAIWLGGASLLEADEQATTALVTFVIAALAAYDPARRLGQARANIERSLVGVRLMYDFLDTPLTDPDMPGARPLSLTAGEVRFDAVDFAYEPGKPVLKAVSFAAPAGQTTAIVGRSGSGKTTIANLIQRFWRVDGGRILVDGQDIAGVQVASLRAHLAYVGQDAYVFDGSLRENVMVGDPDASEQAMLAAAEAAGARGFIEAGAQGFDALAGELGSNLSGGQRQRVAIARAILRDAPIVVLDEPTSALDVETERAIQASLDRLATGRTTIVIAHRLSTIENADHIVVMDEGRVVEQGTHAALIAADGPYARLYRQRRSEPVQSDETA